MDLTVRITKVEKYEYRNQDNEMCVGYDCEAVEAHPAVGAYINRCNFRTQETLVEGDIVTVTVNLARKILKTRDGRDFTKTDVAIINPRIISPETF